MQNLRQYLPSKKFAIILISIIVALVIIFITKTFVNIKDSGEAEVTAEVKKEIALREQFLEVDSDNDGLKDWEESLWQTDPKNPDTDGDGTSDGAEIKAYRDPLKAGPNDGFDPKEIAETKKIIDEYESLSVTEKFSRTLFSQYLATQKADTAMSESDANYLVENMLADLPKETLTDKYLSSDISVLTDATTEDLDIYRSKLVNILDKNFWSYFTTEMTIFQNAMSTDSKDELKKLDPIIQSYKDASIAVSKLKTPEIFKTNGVNIANLLYNMSISVQGFKTVFEDSIPALMAYDNFYVYYNLLDKEIAELNLYNN
jgi:hypothetical protein